MNTLRRHPYPTTLVICSLSLISFLLLTNPYDVALGLLVVPAVLFFLIAYCLAHIIIYNLDLIKKDLRKRKVVALVSASLLTVVGILQSTGGISGIDIILLALIVVVSAIYIEKF